MGRRSLVARCVVALVITLFVSPPAPAETAEPGARLYRRHCAVCHGPHGRGDGPDASLYDPPPRDLKSGFLAGAKTEDVVGRVRHGTPLVLDLPSLRARAKDTEALAAHLERLPAADWRLADAGQELYIDHCEVCHGPYGHPGGTLPEGVGTPRDLSAPAWQRAVTDDELILVVRHGRKGMPAIVPRLSDADGPPLAAFVRLLSPGYEIYSRYCASCHGDDGRGGGTLVETPARPTVVFDARYFARRDPEELRGAIWHMAGEHKVAMPHLRGALDEAAARTIVEYLKHTN